MCNYAWQLRCGLKQPTYHKNYYLTGVRLPKMCLLRHLYMKTNFLPRQARDKHRKNSTKRPFLPRQACRPAIGHRPNSFRCTHCFDQCKQRRRARRRWVCAGAGIAQAALPSPAPNPHVNGPGPRQALGSQGGTITHVHLYCDLHHDRPNVAVFLLFCTSLSVNAQKKYCFRIRRALS